MMTDLSLPAIHTLSKSARVWVFQSSKPLTGDLSADIGAHLEQFLVEWAAHGRQLFATFEIRFERFIVIAVDEAQAAATGCSIDKLMQTIQALDQRHDLDLLNRMKVAYRSGEEVLECDVSTFSAMLQDGSADMDTVVFNNVVQNIHELETNWETTVSQSWHANLIP